MHLQQKFYDLYAPEKEISIDKSMVYFKGHVIFKQHMTQKTVKFGIKLWMLCESETGYCSKFHVYLGKKAGADNDGVIRKTGTVVTRLCRGFEHRGYKLYVDNFCTGVPLILKLSEVGIQSYGTIRTNQKFYPSELVQEAKQVNQGQFTWKTFDTLVAMVWKDHKPVYFLSSIHDPVNGEPVTRNMKDNNSRHTRAAVACPKLVNDYHTFMGGVDLSDQQAYVRKNTRQMKWYMRLVIKCIQLGIFNAYNLETYYRTHRHHNQWKRDLLQFKEEVIGDLIDGVRAPWFSNGKRKRQQGGDQPDHLIGVGVHFPHRGDGKEHTCIVCREKIKRWKKANRNEQIENCPHGKKPKRSVFCCSGCMPPGSKYLCIKNDKNCFEIYHTCKEFWH